MPLTYVPVPDSLDLDSGEACPTALGVELDEGRRETALARADFKRAEAAALSAQALALLRGAEVIERTWGIPAPCAAHGRRGCTAGRCS